MSADFGTLAARVSTGLPDVQACVVLSADGLVLGAHPASAEARGAAAWARLAALGEVERGFVAMPAEQWVFCRRGPYAAVAVTEVSARPGVVMVELEAILLEAERARARPAANRTKAAKEPAEPARRRRPLLHRDRPKEPASPAPVVAVAADPDSEVDPLELVREFGGLIGDGGMG